MTDSSQVLPIVLGDKFPREWPKIFAFSSRDDCGHVLLRFVCFCQTYRSVLANINSGLWHNQQIWVMVVGEKLSTLEATQREHFYLPAPPLFYTVVPSDST